MSQYDRQAQDDYIAALDAAAKAVVGAADAGQAVGGRDPYADLRLLGALEDVLIDFGGDAPSGRLAAFVLLGFLVRDGQGMYGRTADEGDLLDRGYEVVSAYAHDLEEVMPS